MNIIQMMHYAQYRFLIEKRDFGEQSSLAAKGTIASLMGGNLFTLIYMLGISSSILNLSYWQIALFFAFPIYFIVDFFSLKQNQLDDENNEEYRQKGKFYLDIITYTPLVYVIYLFIKNI